MTSKTSVILLFAALGCCFTATFAQAEKSVGNEVGMYKHVLGKVGKRTYVLVNSPFQSAGMVTKIFAVFQNTKSITFKVIRGNQKTRKFVTIANFRYFPKVLDKPVMITVPANQMVAEKDDMLGFSCEDEECPIPYRVRNTIPSVAVGPKDDFASQMTSFEQVLFPFEFSFSYRYKPF